MEAESGDGNGSRNRSSKVVHGTTTPKRWLLFTDTLRISGSLLSSPSSWPRSIKYFRCWTRSFPAHHRLLCDSLPRVFEPAIHPRREPFAGCSSPRGARVTHRQEFSRLFRQCNYAEGRGAHLHRWCPSFFGSSVHGV